VTEFSTDPDARKDEQRAIVFLSDGRDESSQHTYQQVIDEAKRRDIAFYCIGFGAELDISSLLVITSQTGGEYYSAVTAEELGGQFTQITKDLGGQYILRWATLKRGSVSFLPSFSIRILDHTLQYTTPQEYQPSEYVGDPLHGVLRLVPSEAADKTIAFLRATYVPRYITRISLRAVSSYGFQARLVGVADGGLCDDSGWDVTTEDAPEGGKRILVSSHTPDDIFTAIPFAAFGAILRFEFDTVVQDPAGLFTTLEIDNTIYEGGQSFEID